MRSFLFATSLTLLTTAACTDAPAELKDPPILKVTSPQRSLIQSGAGAVVVTGTVSPNPESGEPVEKVLVNNVQATLNADGTFTATVSIKPGATLIHTEARDAAGQKAEDTRAVHAGQLRPVGANIEDALQVAMSKNAFAKLSAAAGPMIESIDLGAMLAPMQPMARWSDETGEDCNFARYFVDDVNLGNVEISIVPSLQGLQFRAQIDNLDVASHARYSLVCADGTNNVRIKAPKVVVAGTLVVTPSGNQGFKTALTNETVQITGLDIQAGGIPGDIIDFLNLDTAAGWIISKAAPLAMEPMMNKALGGLAGPQTIDMMGKSLTMEVDPTSIDIDGNGAMISLSTKMVIAGSESSPGFIFTDNGLPALDAGQGFAMGLADDLANEMMAEVKAIGLLNLHMPAEAGSFNETAMEMTLPPLLSADPADGKMKVIIGDMITTYMDHGTPVGRAAINASIDLQIVPASNGYGVAIQLGTPTAHVDVLDDIANATRLSNEDLANATEVSLNAQIAAISKLLVAIPMPSVAGLQMKNVSLGADDGYVMLKGEIE
ncbi:MAG: hypothetical protein AB7T06_02570 [Kofleriaceae bacterium]